MRYINPLVLISSVSNSSSMYLFLLYIPAVLLVDSIVFWLVYAAFVVWWSASVVPANSLTQLGINLGVSLGVALVLALVMRAFQLRPLFPLLPNGWKTINSVLIALALALIGLYGYGHMIELTGNPSPDDLFPIGRVRSLMSVVLIIAILYAATQKWQVILGMTVRRESISISISTTEHENRVYHNAMSLMPLGLIMGIAILVDIVLVQTLNRNLALLAVFGGGWALFALFNTCWLLSLTAAAAESDTLVAESPLLSTEERRRKGS